MGSGDARVLGALRMRRESACSAALASLQRSTPSWLAGPAGAKVCSVAFFDARILVSTTISTGRP